MATQAAARSNGLAEFATKLLGEREVIPRAEIVVEQIAGLFADAAVVLYLLEQNHGKMEWRHKAAQGAVSLPKSLVPHDSGTLGRAWQKREPLSFSGETIHREDYSHLDVRKTVVSLGYQ